MKLFEEPMDVDLYVDSRPLTKEEESELSEHIKLEKQKFIDRNSEKSKRQLSLQKKTIVRKKELAG